MRHHSSQVYRGGCPWELQLSVTHMEKCTGKQKYFFFIQGFPCLYMADGSYRTHCARAVYKTTLEDAQFFHTTSQTRVIFHHLRTISKPILGGMYIYFIPFPSEVRTLDTPTQTEALVIFIDSSLNQTRTSIFLMSQKTILMLFKKVVL